MRDRPGAATHLLLTRTAPEQTAANLSDAVEGLNYFSWIPQPL